MYRYGEADRVYTPHRPATGMPMVIEGEKALVVIDPGFDSWNYMQKNGTAEGAPFDQVAEFSRRTGKPVGRVIFTHIHNDHTKDYVFYKPVWPDAKYIASDTQAALHKKMKGACPIDLVVKGDCNYEFDGMHFRFLRTPGHSRHGDDISIYFVEQSVLFSGDLVQPHGQVYERGEHGFFSFMPFYVRGEDCLRSLQKLIDLSPRITRASHGELLHGADPLKTNRRVAERAKELAYQLVQEHPDEKDLVLAGWAFDTIGAERNVPREDIERRKKERWYMTQDVHGILCFVRDAKRKLVSAE